MTAFEKSFRSRCTGFHTHMTVSDEGEGCLVLDCSGFHIPGGDLGVFVADLARAAGKPEPVILDRLTREQCHQHSVDGIRTYLAEGRLVGLDGNNDDISPATALILAARLASLAGLAASEPDTADVGNLATHLARERGALHACPADMVNALAALRWMREREAKP